jgi:hypothetical protein
MLQIVVMLYIYSIIMHISCTLHVYFIVGACFSAVVIPAVSSLLWQSESFAAFSSQCKQPHLLLATSYDTSVTAIDINYHKQRILAVEADTHLQALKTHQSLPSLVNLCVRGPEARVRHIW